MVKIIQVEVIQVEVKTVAHMKEVLKRHIREDAKFIMKIMKGLTSKKKRKFKMTEVVVSTKTKKIFLEKKVGNRFYFVIHESKAGKINQKQIVVKFISS